jgi:SEC-C motif
MTKINIPLPGRTFERTQGCWNCKHYASPEESLQHWKSSCRPAEEARISLAKQELLKGAPDHAAVRRLASVSATATCPCGSGRKYEKCCRSKDMAADQILRRVEGIANAVRLLDDHERAISEGYYNLCKVPGTHDSDFKHHVFLCDKWCGIQGWTLARSGQKPDILPEELKDKIGDGN